MSCPRDMAWNHVFRDGVQVEMVPIPALGGQLDMTNRSILAYTVLPSQSSKLERHELMLKTLGISNETGQMVASDEEIMQALNKALQLAPRTRTRP